MKKMILLLSIPLMAFLACKKDKKGDVFAQVGIAEINAHKTDLSVNQLVFSQGGVQKIKPGAIIFYKNSDWVYGKLKVVSVSNVGPDYLLTIDLVNYNADGTVLFEKKGITIRSGYYCDLKLGVEANGTVEDFGWLNPQDMDFVIDPVNDTLFYLFYPVN